MASQPYKEILERLDRLEPTEAWMLLGEVESRVNALPKRPLGEFVPVKATSPTTEDWVKKSRAEWDSEG